MSTFGILLNFDGRPASRDDLQRMAQALAVSGNHGSRVRASGSCGMVHHLNPFCPEDLFERQPYCDPNGRHWVVADARLDNRDDLLREFAISAEAARRMPDGQLLAMTYFKRGHGALTHLVGDFAFVAWDSLTEEVFAACDPMGARTLLFHYRPPFFAASTLLRGLLALPVVPRESSRDSLFDYLALRPLPPGKTLFEGIERVPAGYSLRVTRERRELRRYWSVDSTRQIRLRNDDEYRDAFMELFTRAVSTRLRAIGQVGISMSGGLDSSSIGALAARELAARNQRLTAFTLVHRRSFDPGVTTSRIDPEYAHVEAMKAMYGNLDVVYLTGKQQPFLGDLRADFEQSGVMPHSVLFQRRHRTLFPEVQSRGIRVLLNGYNGNTTISYSGEDYPFAWFIRGQWPRAWNGIRALQPMRRMALRRMLTSMLLRPFYPPGLDALINRWLPGTRPQSSKSFGIRTELMSRGRRQGIAASALDYWNNLVTRADPNHARRRMFVDGINNNIADLWPSTRANLQIDERDPTQDQRLVEFCLALPMEQFLRKGANRFLLRNAMQGLLPRQIVERAFFLPREPDIGERFEEVRDEMQGRLARVAAVDHLDFLDYGQLQAWLQMPPEAMKAQGYDAARYAMRAIAMGEYAAWLAGDNE